MDSAQTDFSLFGFDLFGEPVNVATGPLARKYGEPPFTVLNGRGFLWQEKKRQWLHLGIRSELGREAIAYQIGNKRTWTAKKTIIPGGGTGKNSTYLFRQPEGNYASGAEAQSNGSGTSIFDPCLAELCCRWFCCEGGQIVDPFAGGSVRGVVATKSNAGYFRTESFSRTVRKSGLSLPTSRAKRARSKAFTVLMSRGPLSAKRAFVCLRN